MAKGQKRSNRETKKPKQKKAPEKVESPLGIQIKPTDKTNVARSKTKGKS